MKKAKQNLYLGPRSCFLPRGAHTLRPTRARVRRIPSKAFRSASRGIRCYVNRRAITMIETGSVDDRLGLDVKLADQQRLRSRRRVLRRGTFDWRRLRPREPRRHRPGNPRSLRSSRRDQASFVLRSCLRRH